MYFQSTKLYDILGKMGRRNSPPNNSSFLSNLKNVKTNTILTT